MGFHLPQSTDNGKIILGLYMNSEKESDVLDPSIKKCISTTSNLVFGQKERNIAVDTYCQT